MKNEAAKGHILALITILIWGTTFVSTKILLRDFSPIEILFTRFLIGFGALWLICPQKLKSQNKKQEFYFAAAGLSGVTLYFLLENIALTYSLASNVGIIMSTAPFFTAVLFCLIFKERLKKRFLFGFIVAMSGVILINFNEVSVLKLNPLGNILALSASMVWAVYSVLMKKIGSFSFNTIAVTRRTFFYGLLFMLPVVLTDFRPDFSSFLNGINLFNLLYLGFGASALCFASWNVALNILGAVRINAYIYAVPVITLVFSMLILHEHITYLALSGMVLALGGLFISQHKFCDKIKEQSFELQTAKIKVESESIK